MLNRKYYSFERNNYYYGKLLTSKDFLGEQSYGNAKRRFTNRTLHGTGVVKGLNVVMADDTSIVLQSGFALDGAGREVVVPETQVLKLATIEGYSSLKTDCAYLGIAYDEKETDPVYAVMGMQGNEEGKSFNRLKEGFKLFLLDEADCVKNESLEDSFMNETVIYADEDIKVTQYVPSFAVRGKALKGKVVILKKSHLPVVFSLKYTLEAADFAEKKVSIAADNLLLENGQKQVLGFSVNPQEYVFGSQDIVLSATGIQIQKAEHKETIKESKNVSITPVAENMREYILKKFYEGAMDAELDRTYDEMLMIARIKLLKSGNSSIIDEVSQVPFEQYVYTAQQVMLLQKLEEYFENPVLSKKGQVRVESQSSVALPKAEDNGEKTHSSGVFEMSLGAGGEAGHSYFSEEIMHGLGTGAVYVEVGIEYLNKDAKTKENWEEIILGDNSIFAASATAEEKLYQVDTGVKILPDRGTFVVGVRPKTKTGKISLRIRWYAMKTEDIQQRVNKDKEQQGAIMISPDTIVLPPKGTAHINPIFINMPEEALSYTLLDAEGGKIENNGMYTAPAKEGVYEIKAACISNPEIFTHAFMIVSQKKSE